MDKEVACLKVYRASCLLLTLKNAASHRLINRATRVNSWAVNLRYDLCVFHKSVVFMVF